MVAGTFHVPSAFREADVTEKSSPKSASGYGTRSVPASAPVKALDQEGGSPSQANVTGL
jgi:hypothetical protein